MIKAENINKTRYAGIPKRTIQTINDYVENKFTPGSFVQSVLENDLIGSCRRADIHNRAALFEIADYVANEIPYECWGSREKVDNWLK